MLLVHCGGATVPQHALIHACMLNRCSLTLTCPAINDTDRPAHRANVAGELHEPRTLETVEVLNADVSADSSMLHAIIQRL